MDNNLALIENEALRNFSNYSYEDNFDDDYDGFGDDFVQFDDDNFDGFAGLVHSFANEIRSQRAFIFTINNTNATGEKYYFTVGYEVLFSLLSNAGNGIMFEGPFLSVAGNPLTCSGQTNSYTNFWMFSLLNPTRVVALKILSTELANHEQAFEVERLSPYKKIGTRHIFASVYKNEFVQNQTITTIKEGFDFNNQTKVTGWIAPNSSITYTFIMGSVLNTAAALSRKRVRAKKGALGKGKSVTGFSD